MLENETTVYNLRLPTPNSMSSTPSQREGWIVKMKRENAIQLILYVYNLFSVYS